MEIHYSDVPPLVPTPQPYPLEAFSTLRRIMPVRARIHDNVVFGPEEELIPAHLSFGQFLFDQLRKGGDKVSQICPETEKSATYNNILQNSVNLSIALQKLGLKKGDVVALSCENRFEFMVTVLAVIFSGGVLSTFNITYSLGELKHLINITKPKFIFTSPITAQNIYDCSHDLQVVQKLIVFGEYEVVPALLYDNLIKGDVNLDSYPLVDVDGNDTVAVMCSSGTTGLPKGVELTHINFLTLCAHMRYYLLSSKGRSTHDVKSALSLIPWFHAYGLISTLAIMALHIKVIFLVRFEEKQFLETIQKYKINMVTLVPPLAVFLAKHPLVEKYDLSSLIEVWCGAAPLSNEIKNAVTQRTGIKAIRQGYGLTEATMACCVELINSSEGSCGPPAPGMKIKVTDIESGKKLGPLIEGELWIKSPLRMKGYLGDRAASDALYDAEGFVRTGDIGYYDHSGCFYIVDRLKELIKYKGFQVAPAEIEALLLQHSGVMECGVVGAPDDVAGELPTAFVVPRPGASLTAGDLVKHVASKVSPAKHLRGGVIFVKEIPKNASGKILRRELRELLKKRQKSKL